MTDKKKKLSKLDIAVLVTLIAAVAFFLLYNFLIKTYFLGRYESAFFVERDMMKFFSLPFLITVFAVVVYYFAKERKMSSKKYLILSLFISFVILAVTIVCNCNVWVATEDGISYNTLFKDKKVVYSYDDIETVSLYYSGDGLRNRGRTLTYNVTMNDGEEIEIQLSDSYSENYNLFIDFDEKVSSKRTTSGEFAEMANLDELNNYYRELF